MAFKQFKFPLRQQVNIPGYKDTKGVIVSRGEDMDYGFHYSLAWIDSRGRPAQHGSYESELIAANTAKKPARRKAKKTTSKKR